MHLLTAPVCFPAVMAKQAKDTKQLGVRIDTPVFKRLENFCIAHPWQPSMASMVQRAIVEFLEREEPKLPAKPKPR